MTKTQFIVIGIALGFVVIFLILLIWILQIQKEEQAKPKVIPSATPTMSFTNDRRPTVAATVTEAPQLAVITTDPKDGASNVSTTTKITIAFNRNFQMKDVIYSMAPRTEYKLTVIGKTLQVSFPNGLLPSTEYTFKVNTLTQLPRLFTFTTSGDAPVEIPDTRPIGASEIEKEYQRQNNPDIYLRNATPYENQYFSITSEYNEPSDTFVFTATMKGTDAERSQKEFMNWLKNTQRLKQEQIDKLQITYQ